MATLATADPCHVRVPAGVVVLASLLLACGMLVPAEGSEPATCGEQEHAGGDWTGLNRDHTNTRHQEHEDVIGPDEASGLRASWATSLADAGVGGELQSTPVVANGCVYVATTEGWVVALNADGGEPVWSFDPDSADDLDSGQAMAAAYQDGKIFFGLGPEENLRSAALDADTGELLWVGPRMGGVLDDGTDQGRSVYASPVAFDLGSEAVEDTDVPRRMVFQAISSAQAGDAHVPYYLLDADSGELVHKGYPIPHEDREHGYGGGGIWGTAAVDVEELRLYAGTSDPEPMTQEHPHNGAILQIDLDPTAETFGEVIGAAKGEYDTYLDSTPYRQPLCPLLGDDTDIIAGESSPLCGQLDIADFGASPNLFVDEEGHKVVTALQKSGVFHAIDTRTMSKKWERILSYPLAWGNAATAAVGDGGIYLPVDPGAIHGLSSIGWSEWATPTVADAGRYQPATYANGVVYTPSLSGTLQAWDADTGVPLLLWPMSADVGDSCAVLGGGVAVARNTVYAQCDVAGEGSWIIAYRSE